MTKFSDDQSKVQAVIVELREHESLPLVLDNMCSKLPEVPITLVHGTKNGDFAKQQAQKCPCVTTLYETNAENFDAKSYSKLMTSNAFWDAMGDRDKTLVFQTDSGICGKGEDVSKFIKHDYCGAPWEWLNKTGNGGFSIRDTKKFRKYVKNDPEHSNNEDLVFVEWCEKDPDCNICSVAEGKKFAVESMYDPDSWAFHQNLRYRNKSLCDLDKTVHSLNRKAKPLGKAPDSKTYHPTMRLVPFES